MMHRQADDDQTFEGKVSSASGMKKTKKRKRLSGEAVDGSGRPRLKEKKHRDNDLIVFADPSEDESLADQNRRALSYAYERFQNPSSWKFNKARQNWLIRNIWSEQAIPEKYLPLLQRYLIDVKGGIRQRLVDLCNLKVSQPPGETTAKSENKLMSISDTRSQINDPTRSRAHFLLATLSETG
ncbi:hypothetical protein F5I97DRAFT_934960 [Phlebopus sp. FC_14]|nr:hypothetical protein F5I97DRAFT_934960 [Phlebopus sp. FC_14]